MIKTLLIVEGNLLAFPTFENEEQFFSYRLGLQTMGDISNLVAFLWRSEDLPECDKDFPAIAKLIREHLIEKED